MTRGLPAMVLLCVTACAGAPPDAALPALRVEATDAGFAELQAAAARLTGTGSVALAASAFTTESEVRVEPKPLRTLEGLADGRLRAPPVSLRLERDTRGCLLRNLYSDETVRLSSLRCVRIPLKRPAAESGAL